jgi:outer membrane protein assembly factor BamB
MVGDDHVLIAEYYGHRVVERNTSGKVVWQKAVQGPQAAQRLANGTTFVATGSEFYEFDKDGRMVDSVSVSDEAVRNVMKSMKLPSGDIVCLTADARVVRYSAAGKELSSFQVALGQRLYGGRIDVLPTGRVLVPHNAENKVVEYDSQGKAVWEVPFPQPVAATRVSNGNTIITSMDPDIGAVEVDRMGAEVWSYRSTARVTRAIRR